MTGGGPDLDQVFRDEATERLDEMDAALVAVEAGQAGAETVDGLFRHAHTLKGTAGFVGREDVAMLAHAIEDVLGAIRETGVFEPDLAAVLLKAAGVLRGRVMGTDQAAPGDVASELSRARANLTGTGNGLQEASQEGTRTPDESGEPDQGRAPGPVRAAPEPAGAPELASTAENGRRREKGRVQGSEAAPAGADTRLLRVPAGKIDHLLDVVAEIMRFRQELGPPAAAADEPGAAGKFAGGADTDAADSGLAAARMLDELKDTAIGLRTLPLATMTGSLPRVVRDLAADAGKDVDFVISGADTEVDRVVLESLSEPIAHLLRNAVKHGIESHAERATAGKPARGRIELRAEPRGSIVAVAVADDGQGVSPEVAEEARRAGSLADLLTRPGYSTATEVTGVAGRGVGLDAVKDYVRSFGGSMEIRSEPGAGTEVVLLLPLALSLMEVLLFQRDGAVYGVPLAAVAEAVTVSNALALQGRPMLEVRGRAIPLADIAALVGAMAAPLPDRAPALVIRATELSVAIACDALIGQQEIAVKPLGPLLAGARKFLGAAVLGDGRIALLIEPHALLAGLDDVTGPAPALDAEPAAAPLILVVEDSFTARELQRSILETAGYQVLTARDGREALDILGREPGIALVVTDLEMPEMGGLELTRTIRADAVRSSLPVVVVTAHGSDEDVRKGNEAGADAYMAKRSFDQQALLATVERLVER